MSPKAHSKSNRSHSFKVAVLVGAFVAIIGITGVVIFERGTRFTATMQIRAELERLAEAAARSIDGDLHRDLSESAQVEDREYQELIAPLAAFHRSFPQLYYVYTARRDPSRNFSFVLDTATVVTSSFPGREMEPSLPGEAYDYPDPAMTECFLTGAPTASLEPYKDNFGSFLTGCAPIRDSSGAVVGIVGVDIALADYTASLAWTTRVLWIGAVLALLAGFAVGSFTWIISRKSARAEALAFDILESHSGFFLRLRPDGTILFANRELLKFLGSSAIRPEGSPFTGLLSAKDSELCATLMGLASSNDRQVLEAPLHGSDGSVRIIRWHVRSGRKTADEDAFIQIVGDDVTALRAAQDKVLESEQRHRLMVEGASDIVTMMDREGMFTYVSPSVRRVLGYGESELVGRSVFDITHPDDVRSVKWVLSFIEKRREISGRPWRIRFRHKSGTWVLLESLGNNRLDHPAFRSIVVVSRDVTERESMIAEQERQNRLLVLTQSAARIGGYACDTATGVHYWTDEIYRIVDVSPDTFKLTVESGLGFFDLRARKRFIVAWKRCADDRRPFDIVLPLTTAKGRKLMVRFIGLPQMRGNECTGVYGAAQDITAQHRDQEEREMLEEQMRQTQRLESLGVLAGGIAHDFNNLLTGILGNASLLALEVETESETFKILNQIEISARRAADLCRQLVSYSGQRALDSRPVLVDSLIEETTKLVGHSISKKARFSILAGAENTTVLADPTQIQQVVMNLAINASEALVDGEGSIKIRTGVVDAASLPLGGFTLAPAEFSGRYLMIEVSDTGSGMTPETMQRIFDPFFTTKFTGRGLGLAAVRGIVHAHKGALRVSSVLRKGTTFTILLPVHSERAPEIEVPQTSNSMRDAEWRGGGDILISDDEETIRSLTNQLLRRRGFNVHVTSDGEEALEKFYARDGKFTAAVIDMTMPKMGGEEVLRAIRASHPKLPVLMISGYTELAGRLDVLRDNHTAFLGKPFSAEEFTKTLRGVIGRPVSR